MLPLRIRRFPFIGIHSEEAFITTFSSCFGRISKSESEAPTIIQTDFPALSNTIFFTPERSRRKRVTYKPTAERSFCPCHPTYPRESGYGFQKFPTSSPPITGIVCPLPSSKEHRISPIFPSFGHASAWST